MNILKNIIHFFAGLLISILLSFFATIILAFAPKNLRLFLAIFYILFAIVFAIYLWKNYRKIFFGALSYPVFIIIFSVIVVGMGKMIKIETSYAELKKNKADYDYSNLNFTGIWIANIPEYLMFDFGHPAYDEHREIFVSGSKFRYITAERYSKEHDFDWANKKTYIFDGVNISRNPPTPVDIKKYKWSNPQVLRDNWEFHPDGKLTRENETQVIAGRDAIKYVTIFKPLLAEEVKTIYWIDQVTGIVLKKEDFCHIIQDKEQCDLVLECQKIKYALVDQGMFE